MKVTCSHCGAQFNIDESKIPPEGARLRCAKCHEQFDVFHPDVILTQKVAATYESPSELPGAASGTHDAYDGTDDRRDSAALDVVAMGDDADFYGDDNDRGDLAENDADAPHPPIALPGADDDVFAVAPAPITIDADADNSTAIALPGADDSIVTTNTNRRHNEGSKFSAVSVSTPTAVADDDDSALSSAAYAESLSPSMAAVESDLSEITGAPLDFSDHDPVALPDADDIPSSATAGETAPRAIPLPGDDSSFEIHHSPVSSANGAFDDATSSIFDTSPSPEDNLPVFTSSTSTPSPFTPQAPFATEVNNDDLVALPDADDDANQNLAISLFGTPPPLPPEGNALLEDAASADQSSSEDVADAFLKSLENSMANGRSQGAAENTSKRNSPNDFEAEETDSTIHPTASSTSADDSEFSLQDLFGEKTADVRENSGHRKAPSEERMQAAAGSGAAAVAAAMMDLDSAKSFSANDADQTKSGFGNFKSAESTSQANQVDDDNEDFSKLITYDIDYNDYSAPPSSSDSDGNAPTSKSQGATNGNGGKDDVEVLEFIEENTNSKSAYIGEGSTFFIRRGHETPKGPFDMATGIYMVNSGQLLGDEEVSTDQEHWAPLTSVPTFADAIRKLMKSPGDVKFAVENMSQATLSPKNEALERAKARYGDRIAEMKVVTSEDPKAKYLTKPIIAAGISALLFFGVGGAMSFTSFGPFGVNWLFPKAIKKGTQEEIQYLQAKSELLSGTWAGTKAALHLSERLIQKDMGLIEPKAIYAQSVFRLKRLYGSDGSKIAQAEKYLKEITGNNEHKGSVKAEILKALIDKELLEKQGKRRAELEKYLKKQPKDLDAKFLHSEMMMVAAGDRKASQQELETLATETSVSARAYTALARLALTEEIPEDQWVEMEVVSPVDEVDSEEAAAASGTDKAAEEKNTEDSTEGKPLKTEEFASAQDVEKTSDKNDAHKPQKPTIDLSKVDEDKGNDEGEPRATDQIDSSAKTAAVTATVKVSPAVLKALEYLDKAIAVDSKHVEALLMKGELLTLKVVNRPEALKALTALDTPENRERLSDENQSKADFLIGQNYFAMRRYAKAFAAFDRAVETSPDNDVLAATYGAIKMNQGDYDKAEKLFARAMETNQNNIDYLDGRVRALIALEKYHPAKSILKEAAEAHPENTRIALLQGLVYEAMKEPDEAMPFYAKATADEAVGWEASVQMGNIWLNQKKLHNAKTAFDKAVEQGGQKPKPHIGLGRYYLTNGSPAEALASFETAIHLDEENAHAHLGRGEALIALNRLPEAEHAFARATAINDKLPTLMARYGQLLWQMNKLERAAVAFEIAKNQDYKDIESLWQKGAVEFQMGNYDEALADLSVALASRPGLEKALYFKAKTNYARGEFSQALQAIKGAIERSADNAEYHFLAGNIYAKSQKMSDAVTEWQQTIKLNKNHADAMELLGHAFQNQANFSQAAAYFKQTLANDASRVKLYRNIADCYFSMNHYDEAIQNYQKVIDENPTDSDAHYRIAQAYNSMKKMNQAVAWYEKTLAVNENFSEAWKALGFVYKEKFNYAKAIQAFERFLKSSDNAQEKKLVETEIYDLKQLR